MRLLALTVLALAAAPASAAQEATGFDRIRQAMNLPVRTTEAREWGVPEEQVRTTIWDFRRGGIPAEDATRILDEEIRIVREGGPKDNFGAFVHSRVEAGMRGRELAEAIHAEQARRGKGQPPGAGKKPGDGTPGKAGDQGSYPRDEAQGQGREAKPKGQAPDQAGEARGKGRTP